MGLENIRDNPKFTGGRGPILMITSAGKLKPVDAV